MDIMNERNECLSLYREKAKKFYRNARDNLELPFPLEEVFVETVSVGYELLKTGEMLREFRVKKTVVKVILEKYPHYSRFYIWRLCKHIIKAGKKGTDFKWNHYCEKYLECFKPETYKEDIQRLRFKCFASLEQTITHDEDDFASLVLTIDLI